MMCSVRVCELLQIYYFGDFEAIILYCTCRGSPNGVSGPQWIIFHLEMVKMDLHVIYLYIFSWNFPVSKKWIHETQAFSCSVYNHPNHCDLIPWKKIHVRGNHRLRIIKDNKEELLCFLWYKPEQMVEQTVELRLIWDAVTSMWHHCNDSLLHGVSVRMRAGENEKNNFCN